MRKLWFPGVVVGCWLAGAASAEPLLFEESDPTEQATPLRSVSIEELLVTARKREERLLDAPVAVTAISRAELADLNVRRIQDIGNHVPNLALDAASDTSSAARANLRGVGNGDSIASDDPGVGLYVDGVYFARAQGALLAAYDLERVEVLRGPQGTLFGKNTIGGAVQLITRKPNLTSFEGEAELRAGNYSALESRVMLNLPLIPETAAARISVSTATRDGFTKNKGTGSDLDDEKLLAFRSQFRWLPAEDLELQLMAEHSLEDRKPQGFKCKVTNPYPVGATAQTRPDLAATGTRYRSAPASAILAQQVGVNDLGQQGLNLLTGANPFLDACAEDSRRDTRSVSSELSFQKEDLKTFGTHATVIWDLNERFTFKSISAWRRQELDQARDFDGTSLNLINISSVDAGLQQQDQVSQELQLLGNALDGRLNYVLGVYGLKDETNSRTYVGAGVGQIFLVPVLGLQGVVVPQPGAFASSRLKVSNLSYAAFGQASYAFTSSWNLSLGLRLTQERKQIRRDDTCVTMGMLCTRPGLVLFGFEGSTRSKNLSPVATLQYVIDENAQAYVSWSRAYKSGGFNGRIDDPTLSDRIDDERLTSYELGMKLFWLDGRLQANGAIYQSIYEDIQLSLNRANPITGLNQTFVANAGRAEIRGAELELRLLPVSGLELTSAFGVTNARYTDFDAPIAPLDPLIPDDAQDRSLPNTPTYTMNLGVSYRLGLGRMGDLEARTDWTHIGRSGTDTQDSPELRKGKHGELDARVVWMLPDGVTELSVFGDNLLDREYLVNGINLGSSFGNALLIYNEPRTFGVELRRRF